jgi:hypothetical protein
VGVALNYRGTEARRFTEKNMEPQMNADERR